MKQKININDLKPNENNPRYIKDVKFVKLLQSIKQSPSFMEMNPIKVDENMLILGGNMRFKACKHLGWTEVPFEIFTKEMADQNNAERQRQGIDVASYEDQCKEYIVKDNVGFGEWDFDILANQFILEDLENWGLDVPDINLENLEDGDEIIFEKSLQVLPQKEYIIIYADSDSDEWEQLKNIFKCKTVRQGGCKVGSTSDKATTGLERVFDFLTFKKRLDL